MALRSHLKYQIQRHPYEETDRTEDNPIIENVAVKNKSEISEKVIPQKLI